MSGCWLDDRLLVPWERHLLAQCGAPRRYRGGDAYWLLDAVPRATLRALCWARVRAA